jgi:hypothetical protein
MQLSEIFSQKTCYVMAWVVYKVNRTGFAIIVHWPGLVLSNTYVQYKLQNMKDSYSITILGATGETTEWAGGQDAV